MWLSALIRDAVVDEALVLEKQAGAEAFCAAEGVYTLTDITEFELQDDFIAALETLRRVSVRVLNPRECKGVEPPVTCAQNVRFGRPSEQVPKKRRQLISQMRQSRRFIHCSRTRKKRPS